MLRYADLELYEDSLEACRAGRFVALSATEFELLRYLMVNAHIILSKNMIHEHVWPSNVRRKAPLSSPTSAIYDARSTALTVP